MRKYSSDIFKPKFYPNPKQYFKKDFAELPPPEPIHDYLNRHFSQYPWHEDHYKKNRPFFTKDPLDNFIKPQKVINKFPVNNNIDFEDIVSQEKSTKSDDRTPQNILNEIIENNREIYGDPITEEHTAYQEGTAEIREALKSTFPHLEINEAINEARQLDDTFQNPDPLQNGIDTYVNEENPDQFGNGLENSINQEPMPVSESQPEMAPAQDQMMPLADEVMGEGMSHQNLEGIVQQDMLEGQQIFAPEYFGLI